MKYKIPYLHYRILSCFENSYFEIRDYKRRIESIDKERRSERYCRDILRRFEKDGLIYRSGSIYRNDYKYKVTDKFEINNLLISKIPRDDKLYCEVDKFGLWTLDEFEFTCSLIRKTKNILDDYMNKKVNGLWYDNHKTSHFYCTRQLFIHLKNKLH